jgi:hypothetical protein
VGPELLKQPESQIGLRLSSDKTREGFSEWRAIARWAGRGLVGISDGFLVEARLGLPVIPRLRGHGDSVHRGPLSARRGCRGADKD